MRFKYECIGTGLNDIGKLCCLTAGDGAERSKIAIQTELLFDKRVVIGCHEPKGSKSNQKRVSFTGLCCGKSQRASQRICDFQLRELQRISCLKKLLVCQTFSSQLVRPPLLFCDFDEFL